MRKGTTVENKKELNRCPHCQSKKIIKYSYYKDTQRYKYKSCNGTFIPTRGTLAHNIKKRDKFSEYSKIIIEKSLRSIDYMSKKLNISIPTSFKWRHKILLTIPKKKISLKMKFRQTIYGFYIAKKEGKV